MKHMAISSSPAAPVRYSFPASLFGVSTILWLLGSPYVETMRLAQFLDKLELGSTQLRFCVTSSRMQGAPNTTEQGVALIIEGGLGPQLLGGLFDGEDHLVALHAC